MKIKILPYHPASRSAKNLAEGLGVKRLKRKNSRFTSDVDTVIINWGVSKVPDLLKGTGTWLNPPKAVATASNKAKTLLTLEEYGVRTVPFATDKDELEDLYLEETDSIVVRHKLTGHSGEGIEIIKVGDRVPNAPLYTKYIKKTDEYRVHVAYDLAGEYAYVLDVQRKARSRKVKDEDVNWQVRNHHNGFIYAREGVEAPGEVLQQAMRALDALCLDFGSVDVGYHKDTGLAHVYEVNTACGLEGTTLTKYLEYFNKTISYLKGDNNE